MAENFDLSDLGAQEFDLSDLGGVPMKDAPASQASDPAMRDLAISLARYIFTGGGDLKSLPDALIPVAAQFAKDKIVTPDIETGRGFARGVARLPVADGASGDEQIANRAGRVALPAAAAMAAGLAAPAVVPGAGFVAAAQALGAGAAMTGGAAAAGDLAQMGIAKAAGGEAPESIGAAATGAAKTGLEVAALELGAAAGLTALVKVAPAALQVFAKIPAESIKRAIQRPDVIRIGTKAQTRVEIGAARALRDAQEAIQAARLQKGRAVDDALESFQAATGGKPVVDAGDAVARTRAVLNEATGSPAASAALKASELARINRVLNLLEKQPLMTVQQTVQLRRNIDDLTRPKSGGLQDISSDVGQRALSEMGAALRESIDQTATRFNFRALREANQDFSSFAKLQEEIAAEIGTKGMTMRELRIGIEKLSSRFNKGGEGARNIERLAERAPQMEKPIQSLLDMIAARSLTKLPEGTPSGVWKDVVKFLQAPQVAGLAIKGGTIAAPAGRAARRGLAAGATADGSGAKP